MVYKRKVLPVQICQEMRPWVSLQISFIFAGKFNFETENTSKSIVQPPSSGLVVGSMHLQISFIVLFVPRQCQCKIPQKKPFHLQTESGLCRFIRVFPIDRFNFQGFANFKKEQVLHFFFFRHILSAFVRFVRMKPLIRVRQKGLLFSLPTFAIDQIQSLN